MSTSSAPSLRNGSPFLRPAGIRQQDDRALKAAPPQLLAQARAISSSERGVDDDEIGAAFQRQRQRLAPVRSQAHVVALLDQAVPDLGPPGRIAIREDEECENDKPIEGSCAR